VSLHYLTPLLAPHSVCVIGETETAGSTAATALANLRREGYKGRIQQIPLRSTFPRAMLKAEAIPQDCDLALVAIRRSAQRAIVDLCEARGVRAVALLPERESGPPAPADPRDSRLPGKAGGPRVLGPGSFGIVRPALGLNASLFSTSVGAGNVALVSQSGSIVAAMLDWAASHGVGFSSVVTLGGAFDLDVGEILDFLVSDRETESVILYLETVRDARRFMSALRACSRVKPVILIKARRYGAGGRGGADAAHDRVFDAAIRRAGAIRVRFLLQLFDGARTLASPFRPANNRLAILTNGGGPGVLASDTVVDAGVALADYSPATRSRLVAECGAGESAAMELNPLDLGGGADPARYRRALEILLADPGTDGLLAVLSPQGNVAPKAVADEVIACAASSTKPVLGCFMGEAAVEEARASFAASRIPCFATPETAVGAFSYLAAHYRHRQMLLQAPAPLSDRARADPAAARAVMDSALAQGRAALTEGESERVLAAFGIPVAPTIVVKSADEAVDTARAIGYPVVMKIHGAGLAGKSNHGGVILGLADARAVAAAWHSIRGNLAGREAQPHLHDIVIQPMCRKANGRELIVGVRRDPVFGPVITCSAGGLFGTAPWGEAIALPPLNAFLARDLIERTRIAPMLGEFRGMPAIDFIALDDLLLRVSDMVCELPSIERMDIDPVFADETGVVVLDARIGLVPRAERRRGHYAHMAIHPYPAELEEQWQTRGGATVTIRPIRPEDAGIEQAFVRSLSTQTKFFRFLDVINELSPEMLSRFTQIDYDREMALIAVHFDAGIETQVAVSRYVTNPDGQSCEFAVVVADAWRRHGLGVKLMEKLMACARAADLKVMEGDVLGDNHVMLGMMRHLGFSMRVSSDDHSLRLVSREL